MDAPEFQCVGLCFRFRRPLIEHLANAFDMLAQLLIVDLVKNGEVYLIGQQQFVQFIADGAKLPENWSFR